MRLLRAMLMIAIASSALCCTHSTPSPATGANEQYRALADEYLDGYFAWRPQAAVSAGLHEYDGKVPDFSRASIDAERIRLKRFDAAFAKIDPASLSPKTSIELRGLRAAIDDELFGFDVQRSFEHNPMSYSSADVTTYAKRGFAPKSRRLALVTIVLQNVPRTLAQARQNLEEHLPRIFIKTAIEEANGSADFFANDLVEAFADVKDATLQSNFKQAQQAASDAMRSYATWLQTDKMPKANDDFAIGRDAYLRMLHDGELMSESPEQVLAIAMRELHAEQDRFAQAAHRVDPNHSPLDVYKAIQRDHPTEKSLIPDTIKHLEGIRQFLIDRRIVSVPSEVRAKVEETPKFDRASTFASMDAPGPFEKKATEAFYYVTPTEPDWTAAHKEEWLTSFNYYALDVTSIHESYPGHYVQFLHLKNAPVSKVDKTFGSYAYVEGWAHYCEQMLIDEGFPAGADEVTAAKYRMEQSDEALLRTCRLCCSVMMHCQKMSVDDATKFFMQNCYFEEAPARSEAERGTHDPGYGFYTLGKLEILKLRDDYKHQEGSSFSLQKFHDAMLDNGQPPIRLLREMMLKDPKTWGAALPKP